MNRRVPGMKKRYRLFTLLIFLIFVSCGKYNKNLSEYFRYWTSVPGFEGTNIEEISDGKDNEGKGLYCIPLSPKETKIVFKVVNPEKFSLLSENMLSFKIKKGDEVKRLEPKDYKNACTLKFTGGENSSFELTLKKSFLEEYDQSSIIITPAIKLIADDGRNFGTCEQSFKVNTKPLPVKNASMMLDKSLSPNEYILCFNIPDFFSDANKATHSDVRKIKINNKYYNINYDEVAKKYTLVNKENSTNSSIVYESTGMSLETVDDGAEFDSNNNHPVYIKTGIKKGAPKQKFSIIVLDKSGLASDSVIVSSGKGILSSPKLKDNNGADIEPDTMAKEILIANGEKAKFSLVSDSYLDESPVGSDVDIKYTVKPETTASGQSLEINTHLSPATIELEDLNSDPNAGSTYIIEAWAEKENMKNSEKKTWTITIKALPALEIPDLGNTGTTDAWTQLKNAVEGIAPYNINPPKLIKISGKISVPDSANEDSQINVKRKVVIEGKSGDRTKDIIDANKKCRIFSVIKKDGNIGNLSLRNITLQNGQLIDKGGAGIYVSEGTDCSIENLVIKDCKAIYDSSLAGLISGAAISMTKATLSVKNSLITDCESQTAAAFYQAGGESEFDAVTIENCKSTYTAGSGKITGTGGLVFADGSKSIIKNSTIQNCTGGGLLAGYTNEIFIENSKIANNGKGMADDKRGKGASISKPKVHISGGTVFENNDLQINEPGISSGETIVVIDKALTAPLVSKLSFKNYTEGKQVIKLADTAPSGVQLSEQVKKFKVVPQKDSSGNDIDWTITDDGMLKKIGIREQTLSFDSSYTTNDRWKKLKEAVEKAANDGKIFIDGEVYATGDGSTTPGDSSDDNFGKIVINKKLRIEGKTGASSDIINANCWYPSSVTPLHTVSGQAHCIFKIEGGGDLTINKLTLKGGKSNSSGGAVDVFGGGSIDNKAKFTMLSGEISGNASKYGGGAVYLNFADFDMQGGTIKNNKIAVGNSSSGSCFGEGVYVSYGNRATFKMSGNAQVGTYDDDGKLTDDNTVYLIGLAASPGKISVASNLTSNLAATIVPGDSSGGSVGTGLDYSVDRIVLTGDGVGTHYDKFKVKDEKIDANKTRKWKINELGQLKQESTKATVNNIGDIAGIISAAAEDTTVKLKLTNTVNLSDPNDLNDKLCTPIRNKSGVKFELDLSELSTLTEIPNSPQAGKYFRGLENLTSIILPNNLTKIGSNAFNRTAIKEITIPQTVMELNSFAFYGCENLAKVTFEAGSACTKLGERLFYACKNLENFSIPDTVNTIEGNPFVGCTNLNLEGLMGSNTNFVLKDGLLYDKNKTRLIADLKKSQHELKDNKFPTTLVEISGFAFSYAPISKLEIPSTVNVFGRNVCSDCENLESVEFKNPKAVGVMMFHSCTSLKKVTLPSSIEVITDGLFYNCKSLLGTESEPLVIPATVTKIGERAFEGCSGLQCIQIESDSSTLNIIEPNAFKCGTSENKCKLKFTAISDPGTPLPTTIWKSNWRDSATTTVEWKD